MSLSAISIRRPVFAWMLMFALIVFGAICFQRMGISEMPDVDFPVVNIALRLDNAAPEVMELDVVDIIEDAVMGIEGLSSVSSSVSQGIANITCNFALNHNVDTALFEVQNRISQSANLLPTALFPPVITKTNPEDQPIMWVMVTADDKVPLNEQMIYARNTLKDQLSTLLGVGNIELAGYVDPNLRVWLDTKKMHRFDLTSSDIWSAIQSEQIEQPAGRIEAAANEMNIRVLGEAKNVTDFGKIRLNTRGGGINYNPIALHQVARVVEGTAEVRAISRYNGATAVGLGIVKQHGSNAVEVAKLVRAKVDLMRQSLLPGYHLDVRLDQTKFIKDSVNELNMTLLISALLTSVVCYLFLGSWSSTFNVLLAIPTSIVGAFSVLYFFGFTLNTFTLLGLSLAIGIVVDDAIMMLENIVRHYEMGKNRRRAALEGSEEITFAAIATTLAIAAIFIPVVFMQGVVGRFFYQYGITVTAAVFLSLLEALTLTPMRCARFLHSAKIEKPSFVSKNMDHFMDWLTDGYKHSLAWCLRFRVMVVLVSLVIFAGSMVLLTRLRQELIPEQDQSLFLLTGEDPVGTSITATDAVYKQVEAYLKQQPEVQDNYTTIGNYQNNNVVNAGVIYVVLKDPKERRANQREIMDRTREAVQKMLPGDTVFTQDLSLTGFSASRGFPIEFTVEGDDWDKLKEYAATITAKMRDTGLMVDVNSDYQDGMPQIDITPDRDKAALRGVSVTTMSQEVAYLMGGQIFSANTQYPKDGHRYDIRVRSEADEHNSPKDLNNVLLRNNRGSDGELVSLAETAKIKQTTGMQLISRLNRNRAIPVFANIAAGKSQQAALAAVEGITKEVLPLGYQAKITGSAAAFREAFASLIFALLLGIAVAYMVLASQFNSFLHPITVLMALPFSLSGALIALYCCHQSLSLFSMIGLILLMGIVKKNSILLVDFTNQRREAGLAALPALLEACPVRLRPILMTSVATVVGAIPEALNFGAGAETRVPMAISIIGGVSLSTLLTLYVVPCVYMLFVPLERPEAKDLEPEHSGGNGVNLSEISIRRPVFAWMLMAAIIVFGLISFKRLGISQLPDVDFPVVSVSLSLPGAAPEVMEAQVLDPVEDAIMELDGIRSLTSSAQQSSGSIAVEFELGRDIDQSMQEIQNKINQVRNMLPTGLFPPSLRKSNPEDQPILWLALTSDDPNTKPIDMMIYAKNFLNDQFSVVSGVGNVVLGGYVDPALRVWTELGKLASLNLTSSDIIQAITQEQIEMPAGTIQNDQKEYFLRLRGESASPEDFGKLAINNRISQGPNFRRTQLREVANVEEGITDVRRISRINGKRAVGLGIVKQHGSNAVEVADLIKAKLEQIRPLVPKPFQVTVRSDNTRFIRQSVDQLIFTLLMSALLTSVVCYLFLGSWTSTVNILMAIPTSIIGAFIAFFACGFTLNTFTLLGLSLAIGIVVDDAIMMLENIVRHREMGESKRRAAIVGSREITFAALAATIAVVAIFLPVVFMKGVIGRYFLQYGITVTVAVLLSLLEALTLTPMRCSRYLRVDPEPRGLARIIERVFHKLSTGYARILAFLLRHRTLTLLAALALFIGSIFIAKALPGEMMPAQDQSMLLLRFKLPVGTAIDVTNAKMKAVEDYLQTRPDVEAVFSTVGGFGGDAVNQGSAFVTLVDPKKRKQTQSELVKILRKEIKSRVHGMETVVQDMSLKGFAATRGFPVEFIIQGPDWDKLTATTTSIMEDMRAGGFVVDVNTDVQAGMPEVQITPNRAKLAEHGITVTEVTSTLNALVGGAILNGATEYQKGRHRYEIELRLIASERDKLPDLNRIMLRNNRGETIPLSAVVDKTVKPSLMLISRLNRARAITVYANPAPGHSQDEALKKTEELARAKLPAGYSLKMIGSSQSFRESFNSLIVALLLGILVSYMVLASQFNSFIHPVTVLMALPFSVSGAFVGLALGHQSINMYSLIGFILLMGIVKKNSILLVDFTNQLRDEGLPVTEALLKACPVRLRPIIMTSVATVAGALPEALSLGPGSETTVPMALAIIGGVTASTVLTLFVVPCFYSVVTRFERPDPLAVAEAAERQTAGRTLVTHHG